MDRRDFVHLTAIGGAGLGVPALWPGPVAAGPGISSSSGLSPLADLDPVNTARAAAAWIAAHRRPTPSGLTWPRVPGEDEGGDLSLYHGSPGVILFLVELHATTGESAALEDASAGADQLLAALDSGDPIAPGLYTGLAGMACALDAAASATGEERFVAGVSQCLERIVKAARTVGPGVAWYDDDVTNASNDIVSGASGIGLTLLHFHERSYNPAAFDTAHAAARYLATLGETAPGGRKWAMMPSFERYMPNFSHGTAGVATFLARAYELTGDRKLLGAAVDGARYLEAVADCNAGGCRVFHHEPEGEDLFYLSWCHGPAGTARLFYQLEIATGDGAWGEWMERGALGIRAMGVPEERTPGYWNNISQCCGDAGVGEYFLALHALTGDTAHLEYARRIAAYISGKADDPAAETQTWTQAEHRTRPELLQAQTGWMQGAAGVGAFFLHLAARETDASPAVTLPDAPWGPAL